MSADYCDREGVYAFKGWWICNCHPFDTFEDARKAARQKFEIGEKVKDRCTGKIGILHSIGENKYFTVKFGRYPKDIHLKHSQELLKI